MSRYFGGLTPVTFLIPAFHLVRSSSGSVQRAIVTVLLAPLAACAPAMPAGTPAVGVDVVAPETPEAPLPYEAVWTVRPETGLFDGIARAYAIERPFTRLEVVGEDSLGLRLRCSSCLEPVEGYLPREDFVADYVPPEVAAWGELAEFALAVRTAAERHDLEALRPVMAPDFSFSFVGIQSPETAFAVWRSEGFGTLAQVPSLLDRGMSTRDGRVWAAPPEFLGDFSYRGLRLGFRQRVDGQWEWLYLIRGIAE